MSTLTPSEKDKNQAQAIFVCILCAGMCVLIAMFVLNDTFRNPVGAKNISVWKQSLRTSSDKKYLDLLRISLVKSLEDSTYFSISDSALIELLENAEIVEVKGYVPKVESTNTLKGSTMEERSLQGSYLAVKIDDVYVLIADEKFIPVWGTRPVETRRSRTKNKRILKTAENFSAVFLYSFNKTLRLIVF